MKMMRKNLKKAGALILAATMAVSGLAACGSKDAGTSSNTGSTSTGTSNNGGTTTKVETTAKEVTYPLDTDYTVTYWMELNGNVAATEYNNLDDTPFGKALQEQTGIDIEFTHPAVGQVSEQFNLLLSKTQLPDVIEYNWLGYSGGPEKAIKDGVIIELNDVIDKYCPNLKAYLAANPEIDKMVKTDDGKYYCFPFIRGGDKLLTSMGLMLRGDWLEELGLEVPTTIAEWENVLTQFKEKKGAEAAFTYQWGSGGLTNNNPFAYAYGVTREFFLDDNGKVVYGAVQDGYKEYLQLLNKWNNAGLLHPDLLTVTSDVVASYITSGKAGASFAYCGSGLGNWTKAGQATNENFVLVPAPYPTLEEGQKPEMGQRDNNYLGTGSAAISTTCKNVEIVARLLDYAYSEAGSTLYNFGTEGESYTLVEGEPNYTDLMLANPNGLTSTQAIATYARACYNGPFVQAEAYAEQYYTLQEQKDAVAIWSNTNMAKHVMPPVTATPEESKEMATLLADITKYRDQETALFIQGKRSFDTWDQYVADIEKMGLARVLELKEAALARYNNR